MADFADRKLKDIEEALARIENRNKSNFLEIERRLVKLESGGISGAGDEAGERIQEIEDLLLLMQVENTKMKEMLGGKELTEFDVRGLESRIAEIENAVGSLKGGTPIATSTGAAIPSDLEERLHEMEEKIENVYSKGLPSTGKEKMAEMRKQLDDNYSKMAELRRDMEALLKSKDDISKAYGGGTDVQKLAALYSKIQLMEAQVKDDEARLSKLKEDIDKKVEGIAVSIEAVRKETESRMKNLDEMFKARISNMDFVKDIQNSLNKNIVDIQNKFISKDEVYQRIDKVGKESERKVIEIGDKIIPRLEHLEKIKEEVDVKAVYVEKKVKEMEELTKAFKQVEDLSKQVEEKSRKIADSEQKIKEIEQLAERFKKTELGSIKEMIDKEAMDRISTQKEFADAVQKLAERVKGVESSKLTSSLSSAQGIDQKEIEWIQKKFNDISRDIDDLRKSRSTTVVEAKGDTDWIDKKLRDMEKAMQEVQKNVEEMRKTPAVVTAKADTDWIEKRFKELEKGIDEVKKLPVKEKAEKITLPDSVKNLDKFQEELNKKLQDIIMAIDQESASRAATDKKVQDLAMKLSKLGGETHETKEPSSKEAKDTENLAKLRQEILAELEANRRIMGNLKNNLEITATNFFAKNMEEFAKSIDKKLPEYITKDEYRRSIYDISRKLERIEAPDISSIEQRMQEVELDLLNIAKLVKGIGTRMPIIVE
jgi:chromosome segregation ATPase